MVKEITFWLMLSKKMKNSQRSKLLCLGIYIFSLQWMLTHQQGNVALKGNATQSSTRLPYGAHLAIDGNSASTMYTCTHTFTEDNPWWRLDLLAVHDIKNIIITNRGDCCSERINNAEIRIGNSLLNNGNNNPRCVVISSIPAGASASFNCTMRGRYMNVFIPGVDKVITLCEVEVYGFPVPDIKLAVLRLKFNSSEDLTNSNMRDKVLQKLKSANTQSSIFQVRWAKEPELEIET